MLKLIKYAVMNSMRVKFQKSDLDLADATEQEKEHVNEYFAERDFASVKFFACDGSAEGAQLTTMEYDSPEGTGISFYVSNPEKYPTLLASRDFSVENTKAVKAAVGAAAVALVLKNMGLSK